jgi:hypothetical protein
MRALVEPLPPSGGPPKGDDVANRVIGACARASAAPARRRRRRLEFCERWPALVRARLYVPQPATRSYLPNEIPRNARDPAPRATATSYSSVSLATSAVLRARLQMPVKLLQ